MTSKQFLLALALAVATLFAAPQQAQAGQSYHCHCTAAADQSCSCTYDYELGRSGTQEFRGFCDNYSSDSYPFPDMEVNNRDGGTSCTVQMGIIASPQYRSKSCTNWDPFTTDNVKVKVKCYNKAAVSGGVG